MDLLSSLRRWFREALKADDPTTPKDVRGRVLIVGSEGLPPALYRLLFREHGHEFACRYARSADKAIQHIHGQRLDAVVMSWSLPGRCSGHDLLLGIRRLARTADMPVVVLADPKDHAEASAHGATHCLPDSCGLPLLVERLRIYARP